MGWGAWAGGGSDFDCWVLHRPSLMSGLPLPASVYVHVAGVLSAVAVQPQASTHSEHPSAASVLRLFPPGPTSMYPLPPPKTHSLLVLVPHVFRVTHTPLPAALRPTGPDGICNKLPGCQFVMLMKECVPKAFDAQALSQLQALTKSYNAVEGGLWGTCEGACYTRQVRRGGGGRGRGRGWGSVSGWVGE